MTLILDKLLAALVAAIVLIGGGYAWGTRGLAEYKAAQKALVADIKAKNAEKDANYEKQLIDARHQLENMDAEIHAAAGKPLPSVVCHNPRPNPVPGVPGHQADSTPRPGGADQLYGSDFDPTPAMRRLVTAYANALAKCYAVDDQIPRGDAR